MDQAVVDAVRKDWTTAPVSDRVRAGLSLAQRMTQEPTAVDAAFVQGLRDQGLTNAHMERVANIAFVFAVINRGADAVQFPVPQGDALGVVSKELNHAGTKIRVPAFKPTWLRCDDGVIRPAGVAQGKVRIGTAPAPWTLLCAGTSRPSPRACGARPDPTSPCRKPSTTTSAG
jgi:hypothetical protein